MDSGSQAKRCETLELRHSSPADAEIRPGRNGLCCSRLPADSCLSPSERFAPLTLDALHSEDRCATHPGISDTELQLQRVAVEHGRCWSHGCIHPFGLTCRSASRGRDGSRSEFCVRRPLFDASAGRIDGHQSAGAGHDPHRWACGAHDSLDGEAKALVERKVPWVRGLQQAGSALSVDGFQSGADHGPA